MTVSTALTVGAAACATDAADSPAPEPGQASPTDPAASDEAKVAVEPITDEVTQPWGLAFLPGGDELLVTQVDGTLSLVDTASGRVRDLAGVPEVHTASQGGLLDVAVHPDFPDQPWVYLTYSAAHDDQLATHLARARLDVEAGRLDDTEVLFVAEPAVRQPVHFGSRVAFDADGYLLMTLGDRGSKDFDDHPSQDPGNHLGTTVRLHDDGTVPADNPFVDDPDVADEIYSYGHRNVQGMTVHPETGQVWQGEHGEQDGDEINVIRPGGNYGWPVAHAGCEYGSDVPVGVSPGERDDLEAPVHYWECGSGGFPPAGMTFYHGDEFPHWQDDLLLGGLASEYLARFTVDGDALTEQEPLLADEGWRVRDVAVGPHDGAVYVALDNGAPSLVRLVDANG